MLRSGVRIPYAPPQIKAPPNGGAFVCTRMKGIRTGMVVNWVPVAPKSHAPTKPQREFESPMLHHKQGHRRWRCFCLYIYDGDSNRHGSELGTSGTQEPCPDQARRREFESLMLHSLPTPTNANLYPLRAPSMPDHTNLSLFRHFFDFSVCFLLSNRLFFDTL